MEDDLIILTLRSWAEFQLAVLKSEYDVYSSSANTNFDSNMLPVIRGRQMSFEILLLKLNRMLIKY